MMRIAILFDPWMLSFRGSLDLDGYRDDPRGMSGSEQCAVRLYEELRDAGHQAFTIWPGASVLWQDRGRAEYDLAISINCPDPLRDVRAKFKVCYALLNDWTFAKAGFEQHVDLFASPSQPHLDQCLHNPDWRRVEVGPEHPNGKAQYVPDPAKWCVVPLGCDPERYQHFICDKCGISSEEDGPDCDHYWNEKSVKVPGRVVYCSSPDRGLHWLLQEWPAIKRAVPHAHLRIFYRLRDWIESMKAQCGPDGRVYPSVLPNVRRALFIDEALRRMQQAGGFDVTVCDAVSRAQIEREMAEGQVMAFPLDPLNDFTEGFSCSTLESCAARACPITTDADAFGGLYGEVLPLTKREGDWVPKWRDNVIRALTDEAWREEVNDRAEAFARRLTWKNTASKLLSEITARLSSK